MTTLDQKSSSAVAVNAGPTPPAAAGGPPTGVGSGAGGGAGVGAITSAPKGFRLKIQQMLQGLQTVLPAGSSLSAARGNVTQAAMVSQMLAILAAYQVVSDDAVALQESRGQLSAQLPTYHQQYSALKTLLTGFFGAGSPQLAKFGLRPKQTSRTLTPVQRVAKQAKAAATRKLRGTLGSRAKQAVVFNGTVSVTSTATPTVAPASPAAGGSATPPAKA